VKKSFHIQELLHRKSKRNGTKPMDTSLSRTFERHQEHDLKHPGSVELISTKSIRKQLLPHTSYECDLFEGNSFVDMYAKRGSAQNMFDKMQFQDVVNWNTMIVGHVMCGQRQKALELFQQMQQEDVLPNSVTFVGVLNVYAGIFALEDGRCAH
jgi:pentatricopeptide repeat protein